MSVVSIGVVVLPSLSFVLLYLIFFLCAVWGCRLSVCRRCEGRDFDLPALGFVLRCVAGVLLLFSADVFISLTCPVALFSLLHAALGIFGLRVHGERRLLMCCAV